MHQSLNGEGKTDQGNTRLRRTNLSWLESIGLVIATPVAAFAIFVIPWYGSIRYEMHPATVYKMERLVTNAFDAVMPDNLYYHLNEEE